MNTDLSTVLTSTQANLNISIGPNAAAMIQAQRPNGQVIADEADIRRVMSINVALNQERKEAQRQEAGPALIANLAAIVDVSKNEGHPVATLPRAMPEVYRSANVAVSMILKNTAAIEEYTGESSKELRATLLDFCQRARSAVGKFLLHRAGLAEHETAQKLNVFVRQSKCPYYFFNRLSTEAIVTSAPGFNLLSIVWPNDPSKGFYLTFRELVEDHMERACGYLTDAWSVTGLLLREPMLEAFTGAKMSELTAFDDATKLGSKVANVPFLIPVPEKWLKASTYFDFLAKNGGRGIQWKAGTTLSPQDNLRFLGTVAKRVQFLSVPNVTLYFRLIEQAFKGFTYDPVSADKDLFGQLKVWSIQPRSEFSWARVHNLNSTYAGGPNSQGDKILLTSMLHAVLSAPAGTFAGDVLRDQLRNIESEQSAPEVVDMGKDLLMEMKRLATVNRNDLDTAKSKLKGLLDLPNLPGAKGKKVKTRQAGITERTQITPKAKQVLVALRAKGYVALGERMNGWFRQFMNEDCQSAVAGLFLARLDSALAVPITLSRSERLAFLEKDDYAVHSSDSETDQSEDEKQEEDDQPPDNPDDK